jgi:hypothetical protein
MESPSASWPGLARAPAKAPEDGRKRPYVSATHVLLVARNTWVPGTRPGMTTEMLCINATEIRSRAFSGKVESGFPSESATAQKCWSGFFLRSVRNRSSACAQRLQLLRPRGEERGQCPRVLRLSKDARHQAAVAMSWLPRREVPRRNPATYCAISAPIGAARTISDK